jgi:dTDP-4-amino-4,6-dideoxygalactose transaminase
MVRTIADLSTLAIFGGTPAFAEHLYVGRPNIGNRERLLERIGDILDRKWLTNRGPYVEEFERRIASMLGVKHCIAMCNGTVALQIGVRALGLTGEVIVPSLTFIATAHAVHWQGLTPVFCDVDPDTHNLDPSRVERLITPRTTGIVGVHLWGRPCEVDVLTDIARRHNLRLLFDAAHAFGCAHEGQMIGNFGDAEVLSFHATKFVNAFEGGAIVTNNDDLAATVKLMHNFGFEGYDRVVSVGSNGKMSEVSAAMGLTSLESMDAFVDVNYRNYKHYSRYLQGVPGLRQVAYNEAETCNYQYIVLEVDEASMGIGRDQLMDILWAEGIIARRYFYPGCHGMEPYRSCFPHAGSSLPETEGLVKRLLCLPTGTAVGLDEIRTICRILRVVAEHGPEIRGRFP